MQGDISLAESANIHDSCALTGDVEIKDYVAVGPNCVFQSTNHRMDRVCMQDAFYKNNFKDSNTLISSKITVEPNVWIGRQAVIMPGVTIGRGAVVGAKAVVTKDVEPFEIVGGVPAKHIRYRFEDEKRQALKEIEWWNWSRVKIKNNRDFFKRPIEELSVDELEEFQ